MRKHLYCILCLNDMFHVFNIFNFEIGTERRKIHSIRNTVRNRIRNFFIIITFLFVPTYLNNNKKTLYYVHGLCLIILIFNNILL